MAIKSLKDLCTIRDALKDLRQTGYLFGRPDNKDILKKALKRVEVSIDNYENGAFCDYIQ